MSAKCVSRSFVALVVALALAVSPATATLAAPAVATDGADGWFAAVHEWVAEWTQSVLDTLRLRPWGAGEGDGPQVLVSSLPDDDGGVERVTAQEGHAMDPDG